MAPSSIWKKLFVAMTRTLPFTLQFTMLSFYYLLMSMVVTLLRNIKIKIDRITKDNISLWVLNQLIKIYILAKTGNLLKQEIKNIGQALHIIPNESHDVRLLLGVNILIISCSAMYTVILMQFDNN
ncbi:uncharacterized protein LOC142977744 [Anticarsia gemmatalis]|uniref:uncharacterized protein LOC142977744 n=1 Tax=Anticarsia gemmatalis TaxID=129554 RepID=UPI003F774C2A